MKTNESPVLMKQAVHICKIRQIMKTAIFNFTIMEQYIPLIACETFSGILEYVLLYICGSTKFFKTSTEFFWVNNPKILPYFAKVSISTEFEPVLNCTTEN